GGARRRAGGRSRRIRWCRGRAAARTRAGAAGTRRECAGGARRRCRGTLRPCRRASGRLAAWCAAWWQRDPHIAKRVGGDQPPLSMSSGTVRRPPRPGSPARPPPGHSFMSHPGVSPSASISPHAAWVMRGPVDSIRGSAPKPFGGPTPFDAGLARDALFQSRSVVARLEVYEIAVLSLLRGRILDGGKGRGVGAARDPNPESTPPRPEAPLRGSGDVRHGVRDEGHRGEVEAALLRCTDGPDAPTPSQVSWRRVQARLREVTDPLDGRPSG